MSLADPLRAGVVGLRRGATYARQLAAAPEVDLVAVADLDGERVEAVCRAHGVARACSTLEELLEVGLDLVVIATPIPFHAGQSIAALERGVHVLCEVTAVETLDEAEQLVAAVQRSGRRYMMAENACYWGVVDAARALHARGAFGTIFYAEAEYIHALQQRMFDAQGEPTWRARWQDPIIYCTHSLGPLMAITGEYPTEVVCLGSGSHFVPGQQDLQTALVRLTGGGLVRLTVSFANTHWGHHRYHLLGTRATLDTGWIGQDTPRFRSTDLPHAERPIELPLSTAMPGAPAARAPGRARGRGLVRPAGLPGQPGRRGPAPDRRLRRPDDDPPRALRRPLRGAGRAAGAHPPVPAPPAPGAAPPALPARST